MRASWFGIISCWIFGGSLALAPIGWFAVNALKPTQPNHMDMSGVAILFVAFCFTVLIAVLQIVGVVLGILGSRQQGRPQSTAQIGLLLNVLGLFCSVIAALVMLNYFTH